MTATSRRIYLYWLLLFSAALGVGGGAWWLLRREEARLASRSASAEVARRAALEARARLVAENVELFVGDVEAGLLETLGEAPGAGLDEFLDQWERNNPLVRITFRSTANGALLRPLAAATADEARGFRRRFSARFAAGAPWLAAAVVAPGVPVVKAAEPVLAKVIEGATKRQKVSDTLKDESGRAQEMEAEAQRQVASNVSSYQRARKETQELAKSSAPSLSSSSSSRQRAMKREPAGKEAEADAAPAQAQAPTAGTAMAPAVAELNRPIGEAKAKKIEASVYDRFGDAADGGKAEERTERTDRAAAAETLPDRRGWLPWTTEGRLHVLGWVQPGGRGEVRGVEVELAAMVSRLAGAMPAELAADEGYALRDDKGRVLHQAGTVPAGDVTPTARVRLATELLPGWEVVGYLAAASTDGESGGGFFLIGTLLAAILIVAIVAGGSLLLRQARRSEADAAQKISFVANVSHEFKTPLTTIRLYAELLEQGRVPDAEKRGEYLGAIGRETQRLARLVNNVLDFSRLEQGRKKFQREPLDLGAEVTALLDTHEPRVTEAGMVLKRELPAAPLPAVTDRDALGQILLNLLDNACKYAEAGGEVTVMLESRGGAGTNAGGGGVVLRVLDRGPGVPPEQRERIFEKFHRVDDTLTAEKAGAGLGLSIAQQLARGLGGELRCGARAGGGAEFVLELPA